MNGCHRVHGLSVRSLTFHVLKTSSGNSDTHWVRPSYSVANVWGRQTVPSATHLRSVECGNLVSTKICWVIRDNRSPVSIQMTSGRAYRCGRRRKHVLRCHLGQKVDSMAVGECKNVSHLSHPLAYMHTVFIEAKALFTTMLCWTARRREA